MFCGVEGFHSSPLARRQEVRSSRGMASDWLAGRHGATLVVVIIYVDPSFIKVYRHYKNTKSSPLISKAVCHLPCIHLPLDTGIFKWKNV